MFYIIPHVHIRCTWLYYERLAHTGTERLSRLIQQDPDLPQVHRRNVWQASDYSVIHDNFGLMFCTSFLHVFWVDASSAESISMSLKGIPAAQASGMNGSAELVLQWISSIQEEWLIVFDNANDPSPEAVAKFILPGNRGNVLITSRNCWMRRAKRSVPMWAKTLIVESCAPYVHVWKDVEHRRMFKNIYK